MDNKKPTEKEAKQLAEEMQKKFSFVFTKLELTAIFNILTHEEDGTPKKYRLGDAAVVRNIVDKIQATIAVDTNIPIEDQGKQDQNGIIKDRKIIN